MRSVLLTMASVALTVVVVTNAYYQKKQFYPSVVYITKSSPSMAVLYIQAFVLVILTGKLMRKIFFGQLRAAETEHLIERSWYAVTETCLAFTVFRDDFSPRFVALFTMLLFLKCFHWLAEDRIDYMERSPLISLLFHVRAVSLIVLLSLLDTYFVSHAYHNTLIKGPSVQLVFGFEYAILLTAILHVFVKYILHTVDLQSDNPWENKAVYLLYTELALGFVKVLLYLLFLAIMIKVHTFPLFVIRPMYLTVREFRKALNDVVMSRRAIRNMNTLYPDATPEELASGDNVCIICREEMHTSCKKLPCNHIFHTSCLRSWFQRQQTCPTCRMDVLRLPPTQPAPAQPPPPQAANQQQGFPGMFPMWPPNVVPPAQQPAQANAAPAMTDAATFQPYPNMAAQSYPNMAAAADMAAFPGMMPPPFMFPPFMMPYGIAPPMPPSNFAGLTDDELRAMEGSERRNLEARIQCLQDIQTLLNAAMVQIQQYCSIAGNLNTGYTTATPVLPTTTASSSTRLSTSTSTTSVLKTPLNSPAAVGGLPSGSRDDTSTDAQDGSELEGAVGYTPPKDASGGVNDWSVDDPEETEELKEIRRRRVERFAHLKEMKDGKDD